MAGSSGLCSVYVADCHVGTGFCGKFITRHKAFNVENQLVTINNHGLAALSSQLEANQYY